MIPTRKLGTQGLEVPAIGLGCMGMTGTYGPADEAEVFAVLDRAIELGCTFWDTAEMYGPFENEALLGRYLKGRSDKVTIGTKFGWALRDGKFTGEVDSSPASIRRSVDGSLQRLGIETIDLLYQHRVDPNVPIEEVVGVMADLIREGKARYLGLSEAGAATLRRAHAVHPISVLQSEYSLWERNLEADVIPVLRELGIGLAPFSPLGRGFLAAPPERAEALPASDRRAFDPRRQGANYDANLAVAQKVADFAAARGFTPSQVVLAWLLHQGQDIVPLPGTKRVKYLEQNVAAAHISLAAADLAALEAGLTVAGARYDAQQLKLVDR